MREKALDYALSARQKGREGGRKEGANTVPSGELRERGNKANALLVSEKVSYSAAAAATAASFAPVPTLTRRRQRRRRRQEAERGSLG